MTAPCTLDNTAGDPPVSARVGYWVVGVPDGQDTAYLRMVVDGLTARGWHVGTDLWPDQFVGLGGPDRYGTAAAAASSTADDGRGRSTPTCRRRDRLGFAAGDEARHVPARS